MLDDFAKQTRLSRLRDNSGGEFKLCCFYR